MTPTLLGLCSLAAISTHLNVSAVVPLLRHDWELSNSALLWSIGGGASEIMKDIIAQRLQL